MITLFEQFVAEIEKEVEIVVDITTSDHAELRRNRPEHHGVNVDDEWIVKVIRKAADQVVRFLLFHELSERDSIGIHDKHTDLNLICAVKNRDEKLVFNVVTVMVKHNFHFDVVKLFTV